MNPYILLALVIGWGASVGGAGWYGLGLGEDRAAARHARDEDVRKQTFEDAQKGAAAAIAANKPINRTIVQRAEKEIQTERIYQDCKITPAGMALANEALVGSSQR